MTLLRIHASIADVSHRCQWVLFDHGREPVRGEGRRAELPQRADRVQLVIPAARMLIVRARLPREARRNAGSILAFAAEEQILGEPDANQVSWLGSAEDGSGDDELLAVVDKQSLQRWRTALGDVGIRHYELHSEMLLLPLKSGEWSMAWDGGEGFVRRGEQEGAATDAGDRDTPPLSLHLLLEDAAARGARPASIALYLTQPEALPDVEMWQRGLGVPLRLAGQWDWRQAPVHAGTGLAQERQRWSGAAGLLARLRPAAMILAGALAFHACALTADWLLLAREQRLLRQDMEARFRAIFPDAVAVVDPALQMRRKLAEARHAGGLPDDGDFLPMIEKVAAETQTLPAGSLRVVSYESGRLSLELSAIEGEIARQIVQRLRQAGLAADVAPGGGRTLTINARIP